MIRYICDKCGCTLYKVSMTKMVIERREDCDIIVDELHFCPECTEEFLEWVDEEE